MAQLTAHGQGGPSPAISFKLALLDVSLGILGNSATVDLFDGGFGLPLHNRILKALSEAKLTVLSGGNGQGTQVSSSTSRQQKPLSAHTRALILLLSLLPSPPLVSCQHPVHSIIFT